LNVRRAAIGTLAGRGEAAIGAVFKYKAAPSAAGRLDDETLASTAKGLFQASQVGFDIAGRDAKFGGERLDAPAFHVKGIRQSLPPGHGVGRRRIAVVVAHGDCPPLAAL